jgi:hypothetical protein
LPGETGRQIVFELMRRLFGRYIVAEVPDELAACLECGAVQCVDAKFRKCPNRLARLAALKAVRENPKQTAKSSLDGGMAPAEQALRA